MQLSARPVATRRPHRGALRALALGGALLALAAADAAPASAEGFSQARVAAGSAPRIRWAIPRKARRIAGVARGSDCRVRVASDSAIRRVRFTVKSHSRHRALPVKSARTKPRSHKHGSFICTFNTNEIPNGPITITATAVDRTGDRRSASHDFVVKNPAASAPAAPAGVTAGSSTWFSPTSVWNRQLSGEVALAPKSAGYVAELVRQVGSATPWINTDQYSTPVYTVPASQPKVRVRIVREGSSAEPALEAAFSAVPLPSNARPAAGYDGHLVVWQPATNQMWEFWRLRSEGGGWVASSGGAMQNVSTNPGYYDASAWPGANIHWGATATALPLVGGLMTMKELGERQIPHALAMAIPEPARAYVWPAQRSDGYSEAAEAIPEGTIFRLPASLDLASLNLPPATLAIATAAQRYGMVVRDVSGCVCLYGEDPTPTGASYTSLFENQDPSGVLAQFPWSRLVAIAPGV